ncbi:hypothetical protein V6N13_069279 [Hibiscus sabdariffa]
MVFATPVDPRLPKRQRQRNEDPPDVSFPNGGNPVSAMECDATTIGRSVISYKDVVTGGGDAPQDPNGIDLDDDDIDLLDDDIALGSMNGVPTIDFSERVRDLAIRSMDLTLVVKDICPKLQNHVDVDPENMEIPPPAPPVVHSALVEDFGPWMLVEKRKRNPKINAANHFDPAQKESRSFPPITNPMFDEANILQDSLQVSRDHAPIPAPTSSIQRANRDANVVVDSTPAITSQHVDNATTVNKTVNISSKNNSLPLVQKKSSVPGLRVSKTLQTVPKSSTRGTRSFPLQHSSSNSKPVGDPPYQSAKSVAPLDPLKHQVVSLQDGDNPSLSKLSAISEQSRRGQEAMVE